MVMLLLGTNLLRKKRLYSDNNHFYLLVNCSLSVTFTKMFS